MAGNNYVEGIEEALAGSMNAAECLLSLSAAGSPMFADTHNNLGVVLQANGKHEDAIRSFHRAIAITPAYALAFSNLAGSYAALGRNEEAEQAYLQAIAIEPTQAVALSNLGTILCRANRQAEAEQCFRKALALKADFVSASLGLGEILLSTRRAEEAVSLYQSLVESYPQDIAGRMGLGLALQAADQAREAASHLETAYEIDPQSPKAAYSLGKVLEELGYLDRAEMLFRRAIEMSPTNFNFYVSLVTVATLSADDPIFGAMEEFAANAAVLSDLQKIDLFFAFSKVLTAVGRQEEGFEFLLRANALRRSMIQYNERRTLGALGAIRHAYNGSLPKTEQQSTEILTVPIFIVGMPRSGSTLIDQIVSSHSKVGSAGESPALPNALRAFKRRNPVWTFPRDANNFHDCDLNSIRRDYVDEISSTSMRSTGKMSPYAICDKYLSNFRYIGLILSIFPNAKIIHTFRDPIETCLSSFGINFNDQPFTYDLGELGRYYRAYAAMMRHWRHVLAAGSILDVRYEAVVRQPEASTRAILDYCGLDWDEGCLSFHESTRSVRTASVAQVRKPIYAGSVRKWRPRRDIIAPLLDGLGIGYE